jgi:uncharacterized tellurite resistance protein B-like protein
MDVPTAFKVARLVFSVTVRDGKLTDPEVAFMDRVAAKFGIPTGRDSWTMPIADPETAAAELEALPPEVQQEALGLLVEAATVDSEVHDAERRFLETAANAIGWTPAQLEKKIAYKLAVAKARKP